MLLDIMFWSGADIAKHLSSLLERKKQIIAKPSQSSSSTSWLHHALFSYLSLAQISPACLAFSPIFALGSAMMSLAFLSS